MMTVTEIRTIAKKMGLKNYGRLKKADLIRAIQRAEGNFDCFETDPFNCGQWQCLWRDDCIKAVEAKT